MSQSLQILNRIFARGLCVAATAAGVTTGASVALAETPQEMGWRISEASEARDDGYGDSVGDMTMVLTNRHGESSTRRLRMQTLETPGFDDGDKSIVVFDEPRDVKGTALLSFAHIVDADDQWLYLPALKRVKRISSVNKSGPFLGSEFAFEDFSAQELKKYTYTYQREEPCGDRTCHVIERLPTYEHSGYTRLVGWMDTADLNPRKIEYYDRKGELLKTLTLGDYRLYNDKFWRAHDLFMENKQTGKTTRLTWSEIKFQTGLADDDFNTNRLTRLR